MARALDRQARDLWEASGRPLEAPDSLTQARWTVEHHREHLKEAARRVFRPEAVPQVLRRLEESPDLGRTAAQIEARPEAFGALRGSRVGPVQSEARREAAREVPTLARAARDYGAARDAYQGQALAAGEKAFTRASEKVRSTGQQLSRLPGSSQALQRVARAAQRVGVQALTRVVPLPPQLAIVRLALRSVRDLARAAERGGRGR
jgi:hypothetical protein